MRVLITGATGFVGGWLTERLLAEKGWQVMAFSRGQKWPESLAHLGHVPLINGDCSDSESIRRATASFRPQAVVHLAGMTSPGQSFKNPAQAWHDNLGGARGLLEGIAASEIRPLVLHVGTGLVYAPPLRGESLAEDAPLGPASPYAASKLAGEAAVAKLAAEHGIPVILARPFNHIGPRQGTQFAIGSFAMQVAAIARSGKPGIIETGDLTPRRDLTDVRDVVEAYRLLIRRGTAGGPYNIGSGSSISMSGVLGRLIALAEVEVEVRTRSDLLRPGDPLDFRADGSRISGETGWKPAIPLDTTLSDILASFAGRGNSIA
ncbi:MAG: NAD-dependent epimerase/dehydratase family protein [Planctomycetes bacterium]|nr:NAD-dependent epimerase/dehydratase family protein [Planctomycetota bacterium]